MPSSHLLSSSIIELAFDKTLESQAPLDLGQKSGYNAVSASRELI